MSNVIDIISKKWSQKLGVIDKTNPELTHSSDALGYSISKCYPLKNRNVRALQR